MAIESGYGMPSLGKETDEEEANEDMTKNQGKKNYRITARQISNGWICEESWTTAKGEYKSVESFHKENPLKS